MPFNLKALGHVLFYFLTGGRLPWQRNCRGRTKGDQNDWGIVESDDVRRRYQITGHLIKLEQIN